MPDLANYLVTVPPSTITIQTAAQGTLENLTRMSVVEDQPETITCVTSHSNPAPTISWQKDDKLLPSTQQTDSKSSEAVLTHSFSRSSSGLEVVCVVRHAAYPAGERVVTLILDVLCRWHSGCGCLTNNTSYRQAYSQHCPGGCSCPGGWGWVCPPHLQ